MYSLFFSPTEDLPRDLLLNQDCRFHISSLIRGVPRNVRGLSVSSIPVGVPLGREGDAPASDSKALLPVP